MNYTEEKATETQHQGYIYSSQSYRTGAVVVREEVFLLKEQFNVTSKNDGFVLLLFLKRGKNNIVTIETKYKYKSTSVYQFLPYCLVKKKGE